MFFLDFFCGGIVSYFLAETTVGANVGGGPKIRWGPRTQELRTRVTNESIQVTKSGETKNLWKPEHASKVVNPFTRALAPPFIGRRREFYIPRLPSNLRNIPNVNTYKNVFYILWFVGLISYIYKPATSSHFKPGLLKRRLWLGFFLTPKALIHENHHSLWLSNWDSTRFPNFADSLFPELRQFSIILKWTADSRAEA
jgi:hypothetical protein